MPPDLHWGAGPPQAPEQEQGEALAHPQSWVVVVVVEAVAQEALQLQGAEEVVVQNVQWLEGVVAGGPLGLGVGVPEELVGVEHLPKVQEAVDQNDPYCSQ